MNDYGWGIIAIVCYCLALLLVDEAHEDERPATPMLEIQAGRVR